MRSFLWAVVALAAFHQDEEETITKKEAHSDLLNMKKNLDELTQLKKKVQARAVAAKKSYEEEHDEEAADLTALSAPSSFIQMEVEPVHHATSAEMREWRKKTNDPEMSRGLDELEVSHAAQITKDRQGWAETMSKEKQWMLEEQTKLAQYKQKGKLELQAMEEQAAGAKEQDKAHNELTKDFEIKTSSARTSEAKRDAIRDHELDIILKAEEGDSKSTLQREFEHQKIMAKKNDAVKLAAKKPVAQLETKKGTGLFGSFVSGVEGAFSLLQEKEEPESADKKESKMPAGVMGADVMPNFTQFYDDDDKLHHMEDEQNAKMQDVIEHIPKKKADQLQGKDSLLEEKTPEFNSKFKVTNTLDAKEEKKLDEVESDVQNKVTEKQTEVTQVLDALAQKVQRSSLLQTGYDNYDPDLDGFNDAKESGEVEADLKYMRKSDDAYSSPQQSIDDAHNHGDWGLSGEDYRVLDLEPNYVQEPLGGSRSTSLIENPKHKIGHHHAHEKLHHLDHGHHHAQAKQHKKDEYDSWIPSYNPKHDEHYPGLHLPGAALAQETETAEKDFDKADSLLEGEYHHHHWKHAHHQMSHRRPDRDPLDDLFPKNTRASLVEQKNINNPTDPDLPYYDTKEHLEQIADLKKELKKDMAESLLQTKAKWSEGNDKRIQDADEDHHFDATKVGNELTQMKHKFEDSLSQLDIPHAKDDQNMRTE